MAENTSNRLKVFGLVYMVLAIKGSTCLAAAGVTNFLKGSGFRRTAEKKALKKGLILHELKHYRAA